ncbi:hypothetical protein LEMLEM_LOCUS20308, partial [Lemmus lemmus]
MGCGGQFTDTHPNSWYSTLLLGPVSDAWVRMVQNVALEIEEYLTLENRVSVSLVCKQGLLGSSSQTEGPGTPAGTVIYVTEGRSGHLYFSPPSPKFTHS